jgi:cell division protein ZapA (FtsZ GTPase activity inhibitor)
MSTTDLTDLPTGATSLPGSTTLRMPSGLPKAVAVANRYLRPSIGSIEVIEPNDEDEFDYGDGPATMREILDITTTVLVTLESPEDVETTDCGTRVTAEGSEYIVTISDETPEHLVDVAAFSIISAIHLKREAKEAMNRAVVALAMIKPRD